MRADVGDVEVAFAIEREAVGVDEAGFGEGERGKEDEQKCADARDFNWLGGSMHALTGFVDFGDS